MCNDSVHSQSYAEGLRVALHLCIDCEALRGQLADWPQADAGDGKGFDALIYALHAVVYKLDLQSISSCPQKALPDLRRVDYISGCPGVGEFGPLCQVSICHCKVSNSDWHVSMPHLLLLSKARISLRRIPAASA